MVRVRKRRRRRRRYSKGGHIANTVPGTTLGKVCLPNDVQLLTSTLTFNVDHKTMPYWDGEVRHEVPVARSDTMELVATFAVNNPVVPGFGDAVGRAIGEWIKEAYEPK